MATAIATPDQILRDLLQACHDASGHLILAAFEEDKFRALTLEEGAHHGIKDAPQPDQRWKNQVTMPAGEVFEIRTPHPLALAD